MAISKQLLRSHSIDGERARHYAVAHLHLGIKSDTPGVREWRGANLGSETIIYDLNGEPLFYDFPVLTLDGGQQGLVRASANRAIGNMVQSVYLGAPRWNVSEAELRARRLIRKVRGTEPTDTQLVCYAYPKLGIAVYWKDGEGVSKRTIFDVSDFSEVPEKTEPEMRGPGAWSLYEHIDEKTVHDGAERFSLYDQLVDEIQERSQVDLSAEMNIADYYQVQSAASIVIPFYTTRILQFCPHTNSHECFTMHGQENGVWCVVATGQMILDFWRYYEDQSSIASAMGTGPGGTGWTGEVNGLESITCSHFDAQTDFSPTFNEVRMEIDANRPFDYSYSHHAMACVGYRQQNIYIHGTTPEQSVYLYDPWPVNVGTIRWETWGSGVSPVAGFVYLRRP